MIQSFPQLLVPRFVPRAVCVVAVLLALIAGCRNTERAAEANPEAGVTERLREEARREAAEPAEPFNLELEPPPTLVDDDDDSPGIRPRAGEALDKASLDFDQVLERLPQPAYLDPSPTDGEAEDEPGEADDRDPPSAAVRAYVRGRAAYQQGDRSQAIDQLEQARRLDPKSAHVLRTLGMAYLARGDEVRGAGRLKEAVELDPNDASSLFLLGRFAFKKGDWEETIAAMIRSGQAEQADADPAVEYLRPYYLGQALLQEGYDAAAIEQLNEYLRLPTRFARTTRLLREVAFLTQQRGHTRTQVGDAHARLGQLNRALKQYEQVAGGEGDNDGTTANAEPVIARRIYVLLAMNRPRAAEKELIDALRGSTSAAELLGLVPYVAEHSGDRGRFTDLLRGVYQETDRPEALALAVAEMLGDNEATGFLADHAAERPEDEEVYDRLVEQLSRDDPAALVHAVLKMIRARPQDGRDYAEELLQQDLDADRLLAELDDLPADERQTAAAWYLRGVIEESAGRVERAAEAYDNALAADDGFVSPRLATVELRIRLGDFDKALELLDEIPSPEDAEVRYARARVLAGLGRAEESAEIVDELIAEQPRNAEFRLLKGRLQAMQREYTEAQRTFWAVIDLDPTNEDAYTALFHLFDNQPRTDPNQYIRLMQRVQREIPDSRIARIQMAAWYDARREFDLAEENLRSVLDEDPDDDEALGRLVGVLGRADRWDDAEKLLIEHIEQRPGDSTPLALLGEVAKRTDHTEELYTRQEAFFQRQEPSLEKWLALARLYSQWGKADQAAEATDRALEQVDGEVEQNPEQAADLYYFKAQIHHQQEATAEAEDALLAALEADPDHALANNDLGYLWADEGRNLDRALEMTRKAVAAEPENGAFLDSLGWVHYKLGQFDDAARRLREARTRPGGNDPIILDHLADALWRLDEKDEAAQLWQQIRVQADQADAESRPDLVELRATLDAKIEAAGNDEPPPVAPIPGETEDEKPSDAP